jgi:hypothetical protein
MSTISSDSFPNRPLPRPAGASTTPPQSVGVIWDLVRGWVPVGPKLVHPVARAGHGGRGALPAHVKVSRSVLQDPSQDPDAKEIEKALEDKLKRAQKTFDEVFKTELTLEEFDRLKTEYGREVEGAYYQDSEARQKKKWLRKPESKEDLMTRMANRAKDIKAELLEKARKEVKAQETSRAWAEAHKDCPHPCDAYSLHAIVALRGETKEDLKRKVGKEELTARRREEAEQSIGISMDRLHHIAGWAKNEEGKGTLSSGSKCGPIEHGLHFVQVIYTWPGYEKSNDPILKETGPIIKAGKAGEEFARWFTYTSTPMDYKWDWGKVTGQVGIIPGKDQDWVESPRKFPTVEVQPGIGYIDLYINGQLCKCHRIYFKVVK